MTWPGEKSAWHILSELDPSNVTTNSRASFSSRESVYELTCFGQKIFISLTDQNISSTSASGRSLVSELAEYSNLSILRYMIHSVDQPLSGQLVRPSDLPGGDIFLRGTHVLPLDRLAEYFENNVNEFIGIGKSLGGSQLQYGDMSIELYPFPRIPVSLIIWAGDDEFPPKSSLLFDSSCILHMSTDIIWSTAMTVLEMMLLNSKSYDKGMNSSAREKETG